MNLAAKRTEEKLAKTRAAAQARHEERQQRAAKRQQEQQQQRANQRQARKEAREKAGKSAYPSGRPLVADEKIQLHAITVRLDAAQYQQLNAYTSPGGRTLASAIRQVLAGRRVFTSEEHQLLRRVPDLYNSTSQLAQALANSHPVAAAELYVLINRLDAFLTGLHH
jgi:hypothetical protein